MPKASAALEVVDDSASAGEPRSSKNKNSGNGNARSEDDASDKGEDSEEYEIEAILDAKHGAFPGGRMGYLVKWKGYEEEHNSWVDAEDARNALTLIDDFWDKKKKRKRSKPRVSKRRLRKSDAKDSSPVAGESAGKNKGKKSTSARSHTRALKDAVEHVSAGPAHCSSRIPSRHSSCFSSAHSSLLSNKSATLSELRQEISSHLFDLKILSERNETLAKTLATQNAINDARIKQLEAELHASLSELLASNAHLTIQNLENQLMRRQALELTGTCKKRKMNTEGCIITPLNGVVPFVQQDVERPEAAHARLT